MNALRLVVAKCLGGLEDEIEGVALRMLDQLLLEGVEGNAKTSDKLEGTLCAGLLLEVFLAVDDRIQLIYDRHEFIGCLIHTLLYIFVSGCKGNHFNPYTCLFWLKI